MLKRSSSILIVLIAVILTVGLSMYAVRNYQSAGPTADDNLRGLALTIAASMEGVAGRDPSLNLLGSFKSDDIAYAMLISDTGKILFHSNTDLTGTDVGDKRYQGVLTNGTLGEESVQLGTGEYVYEFQTPFHLSGKTCVLRLALHTWRSEAVMRRARFGVALIFSLLAVGWSLGGIVLWLLKRQDAHEKQLARQNELARLGEVGAVLAHEVRNPLAGIKGYGQLLEELLPEGKERGFAQLIVRESLRLEQLADDILFFTRTDSGISDSCDLNLVVSQLTELLEPQVEANDINLQVDIAENIRVRCRDEGLRRLLLNLLTNAVQAVPEGGSINFTAQMNGSMVKIGVADSGAGISAEMLQNLFEPFRTSKARGAGLGLAVCKKIVDSCGGEICAENVAGSGAFFTILLPIVQPEECI